VVYVRAMKRSLASLGGLLLAFSVSFFTSRSARAQAAAEGPYVAISATAGIGVVFANGDNNDRAVIGGQVGGSFGITYFFL